MTRANACDSRLQTAIDVAKWRMCIGCGACVSVCPDQKLELIDFPEEGLRPVHKGGDCSGCSDCVKTCPGVGVSHGTGDALGGAIPELAGNWGPILEVWEGYARDDEIRFGGSSGGLASALALFCVEKGGMTGVAHIGSDSVLHDRNRSVFSTRREDIVATTGSRYSPASPCDNFHAMEESNGAAVFIGKPCDVEGLRKAMGIRPRLRDSVGVAIGIFCAGTPSTKGTHDLLRKYGVEPDDVEEIRYRGRGWPGSFAVRLKGADDWRELASYQDAWGFLQAYRPYRCYLCPDSTSEFADIACGDPWYRNVEDGEQGMSLVLVRTEKGREIVRAAIESGYVHLQNVEPRVLDLSQRELRLKRGAIWGRIATMRALRIPAPDFHGFDLFQNWLKLPFGHKFRSVVGTFRRAINRRYYNAHDYEGGKP